MQDTPESVAHAWQDEPHLLWLDSAAAHHPDAAWSYVMAAPEAWIESRGPHTGITDANGTRVREDDPFDILREELAQHAPVPADCPAPFTGGLAGFFGYDLARRLEILPSRAAENPAVPDMAVGIYTKIYAYNHAERRGYFINRHPGLPAFAEGKLRRGIRPPPSALRAAESGRDDNLEWKPIVNAPEYQARVQKVIDYIKAGDIFQANLSQRFEAELPDNFSPLAHYLRLREANPAPFGGYFDAGAARISCCSPERFLRLNNTGRIETKPIKGTAARSADPARDEANAQALLSSIKDRAENIMIVDLLRNDLSKVCEAASVSVEKLCALESFAKVHHLVSTVGGQLRPGEDSIGLLKACFPGGSITGAPKIRAMEIIEELEDTRRGPYTGALGWIGFDGAMDTNILIRSIVYANGRASLNVGGGVTARSEPAAEYQETLDKAAGLLKVVLADHSDLCVDDRREKA